MVSAIRCVKALDSGDVYLKRPLNLNGSADEILLRASRVIESMILDILRDNPAPVPQHGEIVAFERRKPEQSNLQLEEPSSLDRMYDFIRMLDGEGYPSAFLDWGLFRLKFDSAIRRSGKIVASVTITLKENGDSE